jgi:hypothetical protein
VGALTPFLQAEFRRRCPEGWECTSETSLLSPDLTGLLGYDPRADVVLKNPTTNVRVWVEFEVSRADPVANHTKFATAHLFLPQSPADHSVAMVSPHIDRGRRNLAAATVRLMRRIGMSAFQTTLLPLTPPNEVKRLNHLSVAALTAEPINVPAEIERLFAVVTPVGRWGRLDVHLVGDLLDVLMNLRGWNDDLTSPAGQRAWGKRACTYFAYDPVSRLFAPSKFCAYTPVHPAAGGGPEQSTHWYRMSAAAYADLNDGTHVMDGQRAWRHLVTGLGMRAVTQASSGRIAKEFAQWLDRQREAITVRGGEPTFLIPPAWYAATPDAIRAGESPGEFVEAE